MRDEIVETMARAIAGPGDPIRFEAHAVDAIRALENAGYRIVGRKPTEGMLVNGREALLPVVPRENLASYGPVRAIWEDMFDASPTYGDEQ